MMDESLVLFIYQISSVIAAIVFNFNKILTLENDNKLLLYSLNRIFALSLQKHLEYGNKTLSYRNTDI